MYDNFEAKYQKLVTIMVSITIIWIFIAVFWINSDNTDMNIQDSLDALENQEITEDDYSESWQSIVEKPTDDKWAVYIYLCGSDLESGHSSASTDLAEMFEVDLPDNVTVVVQSGGAKDWHNNKMDSNKTQRFTYTNNGFELVDEASKANMGDSNTLFEFLKFCRENYSAEHTAFIFWNHGGGGIEGVAYDEQYDYDSLTLSEIRKAFKQVYETSETNPPLDIIGFDACLMATIDVANAFRDIGDYLIASVETEPSAGWDYTKFITGLTNPYISPEELGKLICNTYIETCRNEGIADDATLSLIDLGKVNELTEAFQAFGDKALELASLDKMFITKFGRAAESVEYYGLNSVLFGSTNHIDLGELADRMSKLMPTESMRLRNAIDDCTVYKVNGQYKYNSSGISCFYMLNTSNRDFRNFADVTFSDGFKYLYEFQLKGKLSSAGQAYLMNKGVKIAGSDVCASYTGNELGLNNVKVTFENGKLSTNISDKINAVKDIKYGIYYTENGKIFDIGTSKALDVDWDSGVASVSNHLTDWFYINDILCSADVTIAKNTENYEYTDLNNNANNLLLSIPVLIKNEEYKMNISYNRSTAEYDVLGFSKVYDHYSTNGIATREFMDIEDKEEIQFIRYEYVEQNNNLETVENNQINREYIIIGSVIIEDASNIEDSIHIEEKQIGVTGAEIMFILKDTQNIEYKSETYKID